MHKYIKPLNIYILSIAAFFIYGCSSANTPQPSPDEWTPPNTYKYQTLKDDPWKSVRFKKPDITGTLTLAQLLDIALKNSPETRQAWKRSLAKAAVLAQENSLLFPQVTLSADGAREKAVETKETGNVNDLKYGPSGKAELLLFDFGGRDAAIQAAYQDMISAGFEYNQSLQDLLLSLEQSYYGLYSSYSKLEAAKANVTDARTTYEAASLKFQAGLASKLDPLQAESSYDNALYNMEDAKRNLQTARGDLAVTLGFSADTNISVVMPDKLPPSDIDKKDVSIMIEEALSVRPDIQAARSALKSKQAAVKETESALWPSVNLGGTMGQNWYKYYNEKNPRDNDYAYTGYLSFKWDIFDGFYNINKKQEAAAEEAAERARLEELELKASSDVWTKYHQYNTAVRKLKYSQAFYESSKASYELAFDSYGAGLKDILDLLEAQSTLSDARAKLIDSKKGLFLAIAELAHATGMLKTDTVEGLEE